MHSAGRILRRKQGMPIWAIVAIALLMLALWNWQLVVATIAGVVVMSLVYVGQDWNWSSLILRWQRLLNHPNRQFTVAVVAGAVAVCFTYMVAAIWHGIDNHWLASAGILQLIATLAVLGLLFKQAIDKWIETQRSNVDALVAQFTASDDLERLIAVKQLAQHLQQQRLPLNQEIAIAQYCQVLLGRETVPAIQDAALEVLEAINYKQIKSSAN
ncbi:hypothetical protein [Pseudanabaena sp. PCC 6802]|uniref:hypothetical protein n=1 Tax=Pseudanabaena sp. PCC 6802 TaxID=118173 RepID=UPI0012E9B655|nr:hypothetical protein [Pseudanabaena sp. PCC 6802]